MNGRIMGDSKGLLCVFSTVNMCIVIEKKIYERCCFYKVKSESHSVVPDSLQPHGLYSPWNSPGQNTGVGSLSLLQEIFPTQGSNPGPSHCRWILSQLSHQGSPVFIKVLQIQRCNVDIWPIMYTREAGSVVSMQREAVC